MLQPAHLPGLHAILVFIIGLAAAVIGIMGIVFVLKDAEGRRWGDTLAHTKVTEVSG